jgi:type 1 glutamine amidotransferase
MILYARTIAVAFLLLSAAGLALAEQAGVVYEGREGAGKGKHVVLIAGDEEYRSEEMLPQLGKVLAKHHGFKCTVLFSVNNKGEIDPNNRKNIPGLEALKKADLMVMFLRFRELPDEQMKHIADYVESGRPIVAFRTSTHAFNFPDRKSRYHSWHWQNKGGFGKKVLGETWVNHHGEHGKESTLGMVSKKAKDQKAKDHPIVRGLKDGDIWGPTDVYGKVLVLGQVVAGMKPTDPPAKGKKNDPMMPIAWVKGYKAEGGKTARVFTSTMGSAQDFESEGFRRLCVNACYWAVGLEDKIPTKSKVDLVGDYKASRFKNDGFKKGVKPADLK